MRRTVLALGLMFCTFAAQAVLAFEFEEQRLFPAPESEAGVLRMISTTDTEIFAPLILAFQARNPSVTVDYVVSSTTEVFSAIAVDEGRFDLAVSSGMDLQMKLANDGFAASHVSPQTAALPDWAQWRDRLFAFAQEPVVLGISKSAFEGFAPPRTRSDLIELLRDNPGLFEGRIGTYDPNRSGAGYLFATQDARQSDTYWRLSEVMGALSPRLYDASAAMLADLQQGQIVLAYNVLGSYAAAQLDPDGDVAVIELQDFTHILLRTAMIVRGADRPDLAANFIDFLLSEDGQELVATESGLPRISAAALTSEPHMRPIRLDPGLLVFVDPLKRQRFLNEWRAAFIQD